MPIVYLARHATPDFNRPDLVYHLPPGPPLTAQGQAEAQSLGLFLREAGVARLYTSPLERCLHTAQIASQISGAPLEILPALIELQPGEGQDSLRALLCPVFAQAAQESVTGRPIALITHGGTVTFLLGALGLDESSISHTLIYDHSNPLPPAGVYEASQDAEGQPWNVRLAFTPPPVI